MEILALIVLALVLLTVATILVMTILIFTGTINGLDLDEEDYEKQQTFRD
jgi:hypothetical protein